jgi:hypothetical protein
MRRNQHKRPAATPERDANGSKHEKKARPRERPGWMRDAELERSVNAAVQDADYSRDR